MQEYLYDNVLQLPKEKQLELAKLFAEGNRELEALLLYAWDNGLKTFACCAGHSNKDINGAYINFCVNNNEDRFLSIFESLSRCEDVRVEYTFHPSRDEDNSSVTIIVVRVGNIFDPYDEEKNMKFFRKIKDSLLLDVNPTELTKTIFTISNAHLEFDHEEVKKSLGYYYPPCVSVLVCNNQLKLMITAIKGFTSHELKDITKQELEKLLCELLHNRK